MIARFGCGKHEKSDLFWKREEAKDLEQQLPDQSLKTSHEREWVSEEERKDRKVIKCEERNRSEDKRRK